MRTYESLLLRFSGESRTNPRVLTLLTTYSLNCNLVNRKIIVQFSKFFPSCKTCFQKCRTSIIRIQFLKGGDWESLSLMKSYPFQQKTSRSLCICGSRCHVGLLQTCFQSTDDLYVVPVSGVQVN